MVPMSPCRLVFVRDDGIVIIAGALYPFSAAAIAPIGAIVGEWVGSSRGLGFLMLNANARLQINVMFAALLMIALLTIGLYFTVDRLLKVAIPWQKEEI